MELNVQSLFQRAWRRSTVSNKRMYMPGDGYVVISRLVVMIRMYRITNENDWSLKLSKSEYKRACAADWKNERVCRAVCNRVRTLREKEQKWRIKNRTEEPQRTRTSTNFFFVEIFDELFRLILDWTLNTETIVKIVVMPFVPRMSCKHNNAYAPLREIRLMERDNGFVERDNCVLKCNERLRSLGFWYGFWYILHAHW